MKIEQIREFHQATPFQPFIVHMADGRNLRVDHPEFMSLSPEADECTVWELDGRLHLSRLLWSLTLNAQNAAANAPATAGRARNPESQEVV